MSNLKDGPLPTPPPDYDDVVPKGSQTFKTEIVTTQPTIIPPPPPATYENGKTETQNRECHEICDPCYGSKNAFKSCLFLKIFCAPFACCIRIIAACCNEFLVCCDSCCTECCECCETEQQYQQRRGRYNYNTYIMNDTTSNDNSGFAGISSDYAGNNIWIENARDNTSGGWGHHGGGSDDNRCDSGGGDGGGCDSGGGDGGGCDSGGGGGGGGGDD